MNLPSPKTRTSITMIWAFCLAVCWGAPATRLPLQAATCISPVQATETAQQDQNQENAEQTESADQPATESANDSPNEPSTKESVAAEANPTHLIDDDRVTLHMWDGSVVSGKVSVKQIHIQTEFGTLSIPIRRILNFYPGLDSLPTIAERVDDLVEKLADKKYDVREAAHKELVKMGKLIVNELPNLKDGGSLERRKHLREIRKELDEIIAEEEDFDVAPNKVRSLIRGDMIETPDFSVVGKIQEDSFELTSNYGVLTVHLDDIKFATRNVKVARPDARKSVKIDATAFMQQTPKSVGLRVSKGDRVRIRASGKVEWTNWSVTSTPAGLSNQGQWRGISSGTLTARIGKKSDDFIEVGIEKEFVAKTSGVLYLGIAIQDNYVRNRGYRWVGSYEAKVTVSPAD